VFLIFQWRRLLSKPHLHLIALIGVIVPLRLRADWRQEWEAELQHRELLLSGWDRLDFRNKLDLMRRSTSAFWDALWIQRQRWEDEMFQDLRYGSRMLLKRPGFTLTAIFTLSLGVGASTAIFSAVNPILFESLPYPEARQMMMMWDHGPDGIRQEVTFGTYREIVQRSRSFESLTVMRPWQPTLTGQAEPERLEGQRVSASYFHVLRVMPTLGRSFDAFDDRDDRPNGSKVAILSDKLWRRRFGADPGILGRLISLDDDNYTVVGVMPNSFENVLAPSADVWTLLQYDPSLPTFESREWGHHLRMIGRLRSGIGRDEVGREIDTIALAQMPDFPRPAWAPLKNGLIINSLQDEITRDIKPALLAVFFAVLLVLAIACVNVTNLLLARGAQRRGEFAIRNALGAGRLRMVRQLVTESLLLTFLGGALGMLVAEFGVRALIALSPPGLPRAGAIRVDAAAFAFAILVTALIGIVVGLIPALHAYRADLVGSLQLNSRHTIGGQQFTRQTLVVAEVALALVLLVSAGLLMVSLQRLFAIPAGFNGSNLLTLRVQTSTRFDRQATQRFFTQSLNAVRQVPGVTAVELTSQLPLSGDVDQYGVHFESDDPKVGSSSFRYAVSPGYFEMMEIPLRRGRRLDIHDVAEAPLAVVISESLAKHRFGDQDLIGQRVSLGPSDGPWYTIVGVVADVKQTSLAASDLHAFYITPEQWRFGDNTMSLVVRAIGNTAKLTPAIRNAIWSVDKDQPIVQVAMMDDLLAASEANRRFALILFETFGLVALALAAAGIYGVLSYTVTEQTREIGVRLALGAERRNVLSLILRKGLKLTLSGIGLGLLMSWAVTRLLTNLLYGVSAKDPSIFGGVALLLIVVALLACYWPARRATRIDPLVALRHE
jgi:putative ABC transport system permease protein